MVTDDIIQSIDEMKNTWNTHIEYREIQSRRNQKMAIFNSDDITSIK